MNKPTLILLVVVIIGVIGTLLYRNNSPRTQQAQQDSAEISVVPSSNSTQISDFTASFEIYTNGTKRIFTESKYHNQSPDVYIENSDPSVIYVKKEDIIWDDFFKTLPMSLTKDCLITGTKQTFCTTETQKLRFYLNGVENSNTLETVIKPNDDLRVTYGD